MIVSLCLTLNRQIALKLSSHSGVMTKKIKDWMLTNKAATLTSVSLMEFRTANQNPRTNI